MARPDEPVLIWHCDDCGTEHLPPFGGEGCPDCGSGSLTLVTL